MKASSSAPGGVLGHPGGRVQGMWRRYDRILAHVAAALRCGNRHKSTKGRFCGFRSTGRACPTQRRGYPAACRRSKGFIAHPRLASLGAGSVVAAGRSQAERRVREVARVSPPLSDTFAPGRHRRHKRKGLGLLPSPFSPQPPILIGGPTTRISSSKQREVDQPVNESHHGLLLVQCITCTM